MVYGMMATAIQKNGMQPLTNGVVNHIENQLNESEVCPVKQEEVDIYDQQRYPAEQEENDDTKEIDIFINNVVCSFSVRCHLNLRQIALHGCNVVYRRENGMITMKLKKPATTASIWSSGKVTCTGAKTEIDAKIAARRFARCLQKLGFKVRFNNYRVVNVLGTCSMPFAIKISPFSAHHREHASYEPELHPGVTYKVKDIGATLKIFSTGSITVTAPRVSAVEEAIKHIYPLVYEFRKEKSPEDLAAMQLKKERHLASIRASAHEADDDFEHAHLVIDEFQDAVDDENSGDGNWD